MLSFYQLLNNYDLSIAVGAALATHFAVNRSEPDPIYAIYAGLSAITVLVTSLWFSMDSPSLVAAFVHAAQLAGVFLTTLAASIVLYRISPFHGLAQYPGPFACRVSQVPWFRANLSWHARHWIEKMHEEYGPIVRIGPNHLSMTSVEGLHQVQGFKGWQRSKAFDGGVSSGAHPDEAALPRIRNRDLHRSRRRIYEKGFVAGALKEYEPVIIKCMNGLRKLYDKHDGDTINLAEYIRLFAFDFMNEAVFSVSSGSLEAGEDVTGVVNGIVGVTRWGTTFDSLPWLRDILFKLAPEPRSIAGVKAFATGSFLSRMKRGASNSEHRDVFSHLLGEDTDTGTRFTPSQLANESFVLIIAGSDTTSAAYTLAFYYTLQVPGMYQRLRAEIENHFGDHPITIAGTRDLPLLNAIISEAQRFMSPFPAGTGRECPKGGAVVDGAFIPGGTVVRFPSHVIHRSEANFSPEPKKFRPDRWITPEKEDAFNIKAYFPFNIGTHACIGKQVALQELRYSIACTVIQWDLELAPGFDCEKCYYQEKGGWQSFCVWGLSLDAKFAPVLAKHDLDVTLNPHPRVRRWNMSNFHSPLFSLKDEV